MSEYLYKINGYTVGVDKSEKQDETALCIIRQIEDKVIVEGTLHGRLASFVDLILQENTMLKNDFVSKTQLTMYLKENIKKERELMPYLPHKSASFYYANGREVLAKEILEFIEGEKK